MPSKKSENSQIRSVDCNLDVVNFLRSRGIANPASINLPCYIQRIFNFSNYWGIFLGKHFIMPAGSYYPEPVPVELTSLLLSVKQDENLILLRTPKHSKNSKILVAKNKVFVQDNDTEERDNVMIPISVFCHALIDLGLASSINCPVRYTLYQDEDTKDSLDALMLGIQRLEVTTLSMRVLYALLKDSGFPISLDVVNTGVGELYRDIKRVVT